jgi:hypothetical protein
VMGGMSAEAARDMNSGEAGKLMGGLRYEQLCRVEGTVRVDDVEYRVTGTGMRVRRRGVRTMNLALGHTQHSALFASGRAFGAIAFTPGSDGRQAFNEGFIIDQNGVKHAARVLEAPWMTELKTSGEPVSLVLETASGVIRIAGETLLSTFDHHNFEMAGNSVLQQGVVRYAWNGEETIGLFERCSLRDRLRR